jgi:transcriptional regulator with XRE-family HTH domain
MPLIRARRRDAPRLTTAPLPRRPTDEIRQRIAANINLAHADSGLSWAEVARRVGVESPHLWRWRTAVNRPSDVHLDKLAAVYGRALSWFFDEHDLTEEDNNANGEPVSRRQTA